MRGFGGLLLLVLVVGTIVRFWWVIAGAVGIVLLCVVLWKLTGWRYSNNRLFPMASGPGWRDNDVLSERNTGDCAGGGRGCGGHRFVAA